ncbi:hypothetical protein N9K98_07670 [Luminiphilus sp.]|nr:hypothetical protein [Luminiphilus sp.]MDA8555075.1 hypothetical protein [Luminiphilus sp.]MDA8620400.1 hypothetical protein [Luminiphilus sp.]MDC0573068.1 hypothetical protein [Luminiphilus sp.]
MRRRELSCKLVIYVMAMIIWVTGRVEERCSTGRDTAIAKIISKSKP